MTKNALSMRSTKIGSLYLTEYAIPKKKKKTEVHEATNHVFCCDISGSMYDSLPLMRKQLKNRIPSVVDKDDTVTIIVFSGKKECVVLKELVKVNDINDLKALNTAIDKFMVPTGCTCFLDPVVETTKLINKNNHGTFSWIFLSDGGNNDCPWENVIQALTELSGKISSAVIVEYGYYADTDKLNEMTEVLGGTKIQAVDFEHYEPVIEKALGGRSTPKVEVSVKDIVPSMRYRQFIYIDNGMVYSVSLGKNNVIHVPESVEALYFLGNKRGDSKESEIDDSAKFAVAYIFAAAMRYEVTEQILGNIGSIHFIKEYCNAYGKQKLFALQGELLKAVTDSNTSTRYSEGHVDPKHPYKPDPSAYCVLEALVDLASYKENRIFAASEDFEYNRIGAKRVAAPVITEEQEKSLSKIKSGKKYLNAVTKAVESNKVEVEYVDKGYPVSGLTWNLDRANLSALFSIDANITVPKNEFGIVNVASHVYRNYTIICDGILNVQKLPVYLTKATVVDINSRNDKILTKRGKKDGEYYLDLSSLPMINKYFVDKVKMKDLTEDLLHLLEYKNALKYLGYLKKQKGLNAEATLSSKHYSAAESEWLTSLGITDKGYSPVSTTSEVSTDSYQALVFKSDFKSFSKIPAIEDVLKKNKEKGKINPSETFLLNIIGQIDLAVHSEKDIVDMFDAVTEKKRKLQEEIAIQKFGLILSRKWFSDRKDFDDNTDTIKTANGQELSITYQFSNTVVKL